MLSKLPPASLHIASRLSMTWLTSLSKVLLLSSPVEGMKATWPEINTTSPH